ncbi:hypothetical protein [Pseudomonas fulva]|uniref:hypothetical protein n=1 Tax=Pseudomonas fulva TaxID=47880 RepID=UPI000CE968AE|nr:hypothetical protein [Pseudomonas fulva]AVF55221.1 hypothetical protein AL527_08640 [Pseudomonas fulva]MDP9665073.1 TusA-related sulfurtransferase [Pseudomonas cremoricolorata]PYB91492.1 hypothetical protein DMX01_09480 [Pseudomonas fulva]PYC15120.1 hypothetical protein DMX00_07890 [Pseudomonas fulva]
MVAINSSNLLINGVSAQTLSVDAAAERERRVQAGEAPGPLSITSDSLNATATGQAQSAQSDEPEAVKQLRELIKTLQKQLAEEQKQLSALMNSDMEETAKMAAISTKQSSIATLSSQIIAASAQLLELLQQSGGGSAGGLVSTRA